MFTDSAVTLGASPESVAGVGTIDAGVGTIDSDGVVGPGSEVQLVNINPTANAMADLTNNVNIASLSDF